MTRRDQVWGWLLVLVGIARTIFVVGTALRHFVLLDLAAIGVGVLLAAFGIRLLTRKGTF